MKLLYELSLIFFKVTRSALTNSIKAVINRRAEFGSLGMIL